MKRYSFIFMTMLATIVSASVPTRYYVGRTEVSELFWNQMPDSLDYVTSEFHYDTLTVKSRELPFTHYIDSVSMTGKYILSKRTPEAIADFERAFAVINKKQREQSLSVSVGDPAPQIHLLRYKDENIIDNLIIPGECYLLSFWATWCGNCLYELKPQFIPSVAERFRDISYFHFIPICIDSTSDDLQKLFSNPSGCRWDFLADITYIDIDRKANEKYGKSGVMPLNVVIGKDGRVCYIHSGAIKDEAGLSELYEAIKSGL